MSSSVALRVTVSSSSRLSPRCGTRIVTLAPRCSVEPPLVEVGVGRLDRHQHLLGHAQRRRCRSRGPRGCVSTSSPGVRSSTLSMTKPLRPTTRPRRTKNTWTAASRSSSAMPITSMSSVLVDHHLLLARWPCAPSSSRSRSRAARSNSSSSAAVAHLGLEPLDDGVGVAVEEVEQLLRPARRSRPWSISPTHGPEHFSMWNSRHGRPASRGGRACCPSRCGSGTCAAAGRASRGWRRRGRRDRSSARPCASSPA